MRCNEWTDVTQPRNYGYPPLQTMNAPLKILGELEKARKEFIEQENDAGIKVIEDYIIRLKEVVNGRS